MERRNNLNARCSLCTAVIILAFLCTACPKDRQVNFKPELNVFCVINPHGEWFFGHVVIDRTYAIDEEARYDLEHALVVISDSARSETLSYAFGNEFNLPWQITCEPTQRLRLMVAAEGLDTLWAETTVPGDFQIISPIPQDTFGPEDILIFEKSDGAKMYAICWDYETASSVFYFPDYLPDSVVELPVSWLMGNNYPPAEGPCQFEIAAYDSNYAEYKMHWETNTYPRYGVTGGLGVFGSAYTKIVSFYYRP